MFNLAHLANWSMFVFGGGSIALTSLGYPFFGAIAGLLSEPGFYWASWKARSWALYTLTTWWTFWWGILAYRTFPWSV